MRITDEQRDALTPFLTPKNGWASGRRPPTALYAMVAALVKPDGIEASLVHTTSGNGQTRWAVWLVTSAALGYVDLSFDADFYDEHEESDRLSRGSLNRKVTVSVESAHVDLFGDVVKAEFVPYRQEIGIKIDQTDLDWLPVPGIKLTFADGRHFSIPGERDAKSTQEREEREKFLAATRNHLPV